MKYRLKDLTKDVLLFASAGVVVPVAITFPALPSLLQPLLNKQYPPSEIKRTLQRLESQKLIRITYKGSLTQIDLLDKGKRKVLTYDIENLKLKRQKWDGFWRVIIFDIPEEKKIARNFLRAKLREIGFYQLQKSVLVTPWDCKDIVDFVKHYYRVGNCVSLILAKKFDNQELIENYFQL